MIINAKDCKNMGFKAGDVIKVIFSDKYDYYLICRTDRSEYVLVSLATTNNIDRSFTETERWFNKAKFTTDGVTEFNSTLDNACENISLLIQKIKLHNPDIISVEKANVHLVED